MDRKTILGLGIIVLIIFLWPFYIRMVSPEQAHQPVTKATPDSTFVEAKTPTEKDTARIIEPPIEEVDTSNFKETLISVRTSRYNAVISNKAGGTIRQWTLTNYEDGDGKPVDFIHGNRNFSRQFFYLGKSVSFESLNFKVTSARTNLTPGDSQIDSITFVASLEDGSHLVVSHYFEGGKYDFKTRIDWRQLKGPAGEEYRVSWVSPLSPTEKNVKGDYSYFKAYAMLGDDKEEFSNTDPVAETSYTGVTRWLATRTKYFVLYLIPTSKPGAGCRFEGIHKTADGEIVEKVNKIHLSMKLDKNTVDEFTTYIGPMDYDILGKYDGNLPVIMEWGWAFFRPLTKAILYTFQFLFGLIPNYGLVIIVFAFVVKIILYPLTHKSYVGMQKMKEVMPKQKELQKKYKDNPAKMQQELMKLYKEVGYNPLSGCLPLLIQMPILFPIYQVFNESIDLRQAHFVAWIQDLSIPDTVAVLHTGLPFIGDFHVNPLPILMTILTFVQQKFTPMTPSDDSDPAQRFNQKFLLYGMPIMFFFIFNNFSSGLVLYWTIFNVLTMGQQLLMSKHIIK